MSSSFAIADIQVALERRQFPTVTAFNRLEGRPRTQNFDRALRAEVRDALWMVCKQWQMGEFHGSDAGSPVFTKLQVDTTRLTKYRPAALAARAFKYDVPLETMVEQRHVPLTLDLRLVLGRRWLALIADVGNYAQAYIDAYPITAPNPADPADAGRCATADVWQTYAAVAGRAMDGGALYTYLTSGANRHAYDNVAGVQQPDQGPLDDRATRFLAWFNRLFLQPPQNSDDAWLPERLEYQFAASAPIANGEKVYVADEFAQARLDWYSVDLSAGAAPLDPVPGSEVTGLPPATPRTVIPTSLTFAGMPNTRWWTFEDRKTNFGDIDASTTDLAKLLFMEFALVYSNDWFVIPFTLPNGAIASVRGMVVTNVFGARLWIEPADRGPNGAWQLFTINMQGDPVAPTDVSLLVLPTVAKIQDGPPAEEVTLVRDEAANMVWGVETLVPLATGDAKSGSEAARETLAFYQSLAGPAPPVLPPAAPIRYRVMGSVPENWIPFIPVHVPGGNREVQLQRARLPRIIPGGPPIAGTVEPRTVLLREGLDQKQPYFIHEEEVPRAGAKVLQNYQRTRWMGGRVYTWMRARKQTGRGEGSSGLAFDKIVPTM
jgi:hypothetical protein